MKYIALISLIFILTGCTKDYTKLALSYSKKYCSSHDGLDHAVKKLDRMKIVCNDGSVFYEEFINE
jgi:hypothetical protein